MKYPCRVTRPSLSSPQNARDRWVFSEHTDAVGRLSGLRGGLGDLGDLGATCATSPRVRSERQPAPPLF